VIRVLIVDDHPLIREGVGSLLDQEPDMHLVGEAADGREAVEQFESLRPDVTLMDLQMPQANGVQAIATIMHKYPEAKIVVLTTYSGDAQATRAFKAGAAGYLLKSSIRKELLNVIRTVHAGSRYVEREIADQVALHVIDAPLGDRETAVLRLVARGRTNKQIADALGITEETVKAHLKNSFVKLKVSDRTHAVVEAARRGFIEL
jgi:DNA-binding NarL/FixJ family response regulator